MTRVHDAPCLMQRPSEDGVRCISGNLLPISFQYVYDGALRMTISEFRKKHPHCKIGYPSPGFLCIMLAACAGFLILMLKYLIHLVVNYRSIGDPKEFMAGIGAICLSFSTGVGVYVLAKRLGEVLDCFRFGRFMFAVADHEAIIVDEDGDSLVFPLAGVTKLEWWQHTIEIKMNEQYPESGKLRTMLVRMFKPAGDGPTALAFFDALEPRVKKLAPQAEIKKVPLPSLFGS